MELANILQPVANLTVVPATIDLAAAEMQLINEVGREQILADALAPIATQYDEILIDCPPSLGLLTINALTAADAVLVPVECHYMALRGLTQLMQSIEKIQRRTNPRLRLLGVLPTMYDNRTLLTRRIEEEARRYFGPTVYQTVIPRNIKLGEAPSHGQPIIHYDIGSSGADAYLRLTKEVLEYGTRSTR